MKFTQDNVAKIKPPQGKADHWEPDDGLPNFGMRFRNGGEGAYGIRYSLNGEDFKLSLGKRSQVKLATAQNQAREHFAAIAKKENPAVERKKAVSSSAVLMPPLLNAFEGHLRSKRRSDSYIKRTRQYLDGVRDKDGKLKPGADYFVPLHPIPLAQLNRATVARELNWIEQQHGPIAMTRARAALSKFVSWCYTQGHEFPNPVKGTVKYESEERDRIPQPHELALIYKFAGDDEYGRIVRLTILTAGRRSQIGNLKRSELKLAKSAVAAQDRLIELPDRAARHHGAAAVRTRTSF